MWSQHHSTNQCTTLSPHDHSLLNLTPPSVTQLQQSFHQQATNSDHLSSSSVRYELPGSRHYIKADKMSIIQQHTSSSLSDAWRTINIDALTEDSSVNFDTSTLHPAQPEISEADVRQISQQVRQLLRGGDAEGALRGCLETPVYNGTDGAKVRTAGNSDGN